MNKVDLLKALLRDKYGYHGHYYDLLDEMIVDAFKETIRDMQKADFDPFETVDNKAADLAAFCRVLQWYMVDKDYQEFMKEFQSA